MPDVGLIDGVAYKAAIWAWTELLFNFFVGKAGLWPRLKGPWDAPIKFFSL